MFSNDSEHQTQHLTSNSMTDAAYVAPRRSIKHGVWLFVDVLHCLASWVLGNDITPFVKIV